MWIKLSFSTTTFPSLFLFWGHYFSFNQFLVLKLLKTSLVLSSMNLVLQNWLNQAHFTFLNFTCSWLCWCLTSFAILLFGLHYLILGLPLGLRITISWKIMVKHILLLLLELIIREKTGDQSWNQTSLRSIYHKSYLAWAFFAFLFRLCST